MLCLPQGTSIDGHRAYPRVRGDGADVQHILLRGKTLFHVLRPVAASSPALLGPLYGTLLYLSLVNVTVMHAIVQVDYTRGGVVSPPAAVNHRGYETPNGPTS
jgi:hypothetical protein